MWKTVLVTALVPVALLAACGGGGGGSANSGGGGTVGGGSCTAMFTPFVTNASECWEYSTDESNAIAHCTAANGTYSSLACDETNKIATCATLLPASPLTGSLFTVYWFTGDMTEITNACAALSGTLTKPFHK